MRISDWSSDVCSSDLETTRHAAGLFNACTANIRLRIKRCITRRAVITGRGNANEGTLYVILGQAHRVIIATVRRTFWPNRNVTAWEFLLVEFMGHGSVSLQEVSFQKGAVHARALRHSRRMVARTPDRKRTRMKSSH